MTKTREYLAQKARLKRAVAKKLAEQRLIARKSHTSEMLNQIKKIISDKEFVRLLALQKINTAPACLYQYAGPPKEFLTDEEMANDVLVFVVAWKFFFPLITNSRIAEYLEQTEPGFVGDLKDTFITMVMDGPFPGERRTPVRPAHFS